MPPKVTTSSHIRVTRSRTYTALASSNTLASPIQDAIQDDPPPNTPRKKARPNPAAKTEFENAPARSISRTPVPPFSLPAAIAHLTGVDARFGPIFKTIPPKPFVDGGATQDDIDPFRTLVTSIIGQQVSWMAARSITKRFVELFCGEVSGERYGDGPFPTRHQVAASRVEALKGVGCSTRKAEYLIALAEHFVSGKLTDDLLLNGSDDEVAEALIAVRGIGRWTVDMFLIFTLRRPDILPVGDLGVQKGLLRWVLAAHGALPPPPPPKTPKKATPKKHTPTDYGAGGGATPLTAQASFDNELQAAESQATQMTEATELDVPASQATAIDSSHGGQSSAQSPLSTPTKSLATSSEFPSTPGPPPVTPTASTNSLLPASVPDSILSVPQDWDDTHALRAAPLPPGVTISTLKGRLAGKKAKGGVYLLPGEMEVLTEAWRPYRSLGTFYTWSMAGEKS